MGRALCCSSIMNLMPLTSKWSVIPCVGAFVQRCMRQPAAMYLLMCMRSSSSVGPCTCAGLVEPVLALLCSLLLPAHAAGSVQVTHLRHDSQTDKLRSSSAAQHPADPSTSAAASAPLPSAATHAHPTSASAGPATAEGAAITELAPDGPAIEVVAAEPAAAQLSDVPSTASTPALSPRPTVAYLATTLRQESTWELFTTRAAEAGLHLQDLTAKAGCGRVRFLNRDVLMGDPAGIMLHQITRAVQVEGGGAC